MSDAATIRYTLCPVKPEAHFFSVSCTVSRPQPDGQRFSLPAWIPGSYLIRDFSRHIVSIRAESAGKPVALIKIDTHTWQAEALKEKQVLTLHYEVYAWDLSVRGAHLDCSHAFCNGTSVFLYAAGHEQSEHLVELQAPPGKAYRDWRVATALEPARSLKGGAKRGGFGWYAAASYDELIDHPIEMGTFTHASFVACGVRHEIAITGQHDCDLKRLTADLKKICEWQIRFYGEPAPMRRYVFLVTAVGDGYGGLEHRASTALLCSRDDLPYTGMEGTPERYRTFLGLCSHEYFHTWNIKRIKPAAFVPYDLTRENHTRLLWAFEGFTSYYDDLALRRCGLISEKEWLDLTAKNIDNVLRGPGRLNQSLADSSFDAWTKYYRPDENTPNAVVSYYAKGALVALALDLTLRTGTRGKISLDDVMRALWQRYGQTGVGVGETARDSDIRLIAEELSGLDLKSFFRHAVYGTRDLSLDDLLAPFGITIARETSAKRPHLGIKTSKEGNELRVATVYSGSPAEDAGLAGGDTLVAIDGLRVTATNYERILERRRAGEKIEVHVFRRDELVRVCATLAAPVADMTRLAVSARRNTLRATWLNNTALQSAAKTRRLG